MVDLFDSAINQPAAQATKNEKANKLGVSISSIYQYTSTSLWLYILTALTVCAKELLTGSYTLAG